METVESRGDGGVYEFAGNPASPRLMAQIGFLAEIDRLKQVLRRTSLIGGTRRENSAEHSWHITVAALILAEYAAAEVDITHVIKMLLVHDLVEISAGDTFAFDLTAKASQAERELAAATELFGVLPAEQGAELMALWREFEARETAAAQFANAMDRLLPALQNFANEGGTWREAQVNRPRVIDRLQPIGDGAPEVWAFVAELVDEATVRGWILPET